MLIGFSTTWKTIIRKHASREANLRASTAAQTYKSQISTYEARIRRFEKDLAKGDEEKQSLKGQVRLLQDHVKSLMFEKGNLSNANATLETNLKDLNQKLSSSTKSAGENISSKVSNYLKAFDFDKICKEVVDDVGDLQKANISNSPQNNTNKKDFQIVNHATEQLNVGDVCKVLPNTYNELKAEYLSLDGQYKVFTNIMKSYRGSMKR